MAVISNPSFETGSGTTATGWTYAENVAVFSGTYSGRRDISAYALKETFTQSGSYSYVLGRADESALSSVAFTANVSYFEISQSVDFTRIKDFLVSYAWCEGVNNPDRFKFEILVDGVAVGGLTEAAASVENIWNDTSVDLATYIGTGTHTLAFRVTAVLSNTWDFPAILIDNIRETLLPAAPTLTAPVDDSTGVAVVTTFTWTAGADTDSYTFQVATDSGFTNLVYNVAQAGTSYAATGLSNFTNYYWRVRGVNSNGNGQYATANFRTIGNAATSQGKTCTVLPALATTGLAVNDPIGIKMDNGATHWTFITQITTVSAGVAVCYNDPLPNPASLGNAVFLPSINDESWA